MLLLHVSKNVRWNFKTLREVPNIEEFVALHVSPVGQEEIFSDCLPREATSIRYSLLSPDTSGSIEPKEAIVDGSSDLFANVVDIEPERI